MPKNEELIPLWESNSHGFCNIYFGWKGSWKTTQGVIDSYEAYRNGSIVISNCWLNFPHIRFTNTKTLIPILKEISEYCNLYKLPIEAPSEMLKDYNIERKKGKVKNFFLLFDEIGKHLNRRNWQSNFKEEFLRDMLTEPRKYNLTIIGITQAWKRVDIEFLEACNDWFLFSKTGWKYFERANSTHLWVHNGEFDYDKPIIVGKKKRWIYWDKHLTFYRTLFYSGEIVGDGLYTGSIPHIFKKWMIFDEMEVITKKRTKTPSFITQTVRENDWSGAEVIRGTGGWHPDIDTKLLQSENIS